MRRFRIHSSALLATIAALGVLGATLGVVWSADPAKPRPLVLLLVDSQTRSRIPKHLDTYAADAAASLAPTYGEGVRVLVHEVDVRSYFPRGDVDATGSARLTTDLQRVLQGRYRTDGLVGFVLIGTIPLPRAEEAGTQFLTLWPWMDFVEPAYALDPVRGIATRTDVREPRAEVWSAVIRDPGNALPAETPYGQLAGPPAPTLESFFTKNHLAHIGEIQPAHHVLLNDIAAEDAMRDIRLPDGSAPSATELPGGSELARRAFAERLAARLVVTGQYHGMNYADDGLPKKLPDDAGKTVRDLLARAREKKQYASIDAWKNGTGTLAPVDVASQVILYFDAWTEELNARLDGAASAARTIAAIDLFATDGYDACVDAALPGTGYFSLPEAERAAISAASGFESRAEFEFVLRWRKLYGDGDKRLWLLRDGIPRFGKYRALQPSSELRFTVGLGTDAYVVRGARLDGNCLQRGPTDARTRGGMFEVLLGAATARERSSDPPANLALWSALTGVTQAAYGCTVPPPSFTPPSNLATMDRAEVERLARSTRPLGFGRACSATGSAEGIGFDADPFALAVLAGVPFGEAVRGTQDATAILYGDPTFHL